MAKETPASVKKQDVESLKSETKKEPKCIPGRGDLLLDVCVATSFIFFIKSIRSTTQIKSKPYLASTLFFYALAIFSKETAIVLPVILTLYYFLEKGKISTGMLIKDNVLLSLYQ